MPIYGNIYVAFVAISPLDEHPEGAVIVHQAAFDHNIVLVH